MILSEIIINKIRKEGPISFRDFMEMALYYPELGYYTSSKDKIGENGDYYTSSSLTSVFGAMIGQQLEEMWRASGSNEFTIVEYGAGTGALCYDILNYLKNNKGLYERLNYCIIEKSPAMREKSKIDLNEKVTWHDSIENISGIIGCILSNELLDNFSIHQVVMQDELMEVFVDYENGFIELLRPASKEQKEYLKELRVILPKGFRTEINLEATKWIAEVAASLEKGYVMTIDYGYPSAELYCTSRSSGTLTCYNKHKVNSWIYNAIGEQDITSHVNFSALSHWGFKNGLACCGYTDQYHFLHSLGLVNHLRKLEQERKIKENLFHIQTLLMSMGSKFKVLIQQKGIQRVPLSGLRFSRPIDSWNVAESRLLMQNPLLQEQERIC